jgi:uncharacterized protein (DUF983 family)
MCGTHHSGTGQLSEPRKEVPLGLAVKRSLFGRCPNCGRTPLFKSYLNQIQSCSNCGAEFGRIRADDAAPWLTIIVVGHVFLPLIFFVNLGAAMPFWAGVWVWAALFSGLSLVVLPRAKGVFIAILWETRAPGVENGWRGNPSRCSRAVTLLSVKVSRGPGGDAVLTMIVDRTGVISFLLPDDMPGQLSETLQKLANWGTDERWNVNAD